MTKEKKLLQEFLKIYDTGKSRIIKKYNLSIYDIHTIEDLLKNRYKTFIQANVANLLKDYDYNITENGIGFMIER